MINPYLPADQQNIDNLPLEDKQEYNEGSNKLNP